MTSRWSRLLVAAVVLTVFVAGGWWWLRGADERAAARAVRAYNVTLSRVLRELDPEPLSAVATEEEKQRVASYVTLLWGRGMAMDATLESLDVVVAERSGDSTMTAEVRERWLYQDLDADSGKPLRELRRETSSLRYTLVYEEGRWIVWRADTIQPAATDGQP